MCIAGATAFFTTFALPPIFFMSARGLALLQSQSQLSNFYLLTYLEDPEISEINFTNKKPLNQGLKTETVLGKIIFVSCDKNPAW